MHDGPFVVAAITKWKLLPNSCHIELTANSRPAAKNQVTLNVNPLLSPLGVGGGGGLIYFNHIWGWGEGLETGSLFNLAKTIVSVLSKELEYRVEKHK